MTPLVEGLPAKAKEAPSPHEVRLAPLDTNPAVQKSSSRKYNAIVQENTMPSEWNDSFIFSIFKGKGKDKGEGID